VFVGNLLKLNVDELKRLLLEAWFGIQQSIADQPIDQWRAHFNALCQSQRKEVCCETYIELLFVVEQFLARLLNFVL